jgi:hypothetical protein
MSKPIDDVLALQSLLISQATDGVEEDSEYRRLRQILLELASVNDLVPQFVRTNRTVDQFWEFIKRESGHYKERREFIYGSFQPILDRLEAAATAGPQVREALKAVDSETIVAAWNKALDRRTTDPDGAITAARTLLETVCKHILDDAGVTYGSGDDLPCPSCITKRASNLTSPHLSMLKKSLSEFWVVAHP